MLCIDVLSVVYSLLAETAVQKRKFGLKTAKSVEAQIVQDDERNCG